MKSKDEEKTAALLEQPELGEGPGPKYPEELRSRQRKEGWALILALSVAVPLVFTISISLDHWAKNVLLAGLAGTIAGLLHSLKWFYKSIARGFWEWDRVWWRFMNPLVSGVLALSLYVVVRAGLLSMSTDSTVQPVINEPYYAYSIGFLTGLFADNAMNKLRDIAHTLFGKVEKSEDAKGS